MGTAVGVVRAVIGSGDAIAYSCERDAHSEEVVTADVTIFIPMSN